MRKLILPALAVVAFTFMTVHLVKAHRAPPPQTPPVAPSRSSFTTTLAGAGMVEPRSENIQIAAPMPGLVTAVAVSVGQTVARGDVLFTQDDRSQRAILAVREAELASSEADLQRLRRLPRPEDLPVSAARVARATADEKARLDMVNRTESLFGRNVATEQDLIQQQQSLAAARAEVALATAEENKLKAGAWAEDLAVAQAAVERARQLVEQARVEIDRLSVKAPISGTILKVDVRPGEYVGAPPGQSLIVLGDIERLHVRVDIDEQDLPRFRPGLPGQGYVRGDGRQPLALSFVRVEPYAQPKRFLTGSGTERVDTRVLQAIYAIEPSELPTTPVYVGQQIDVYLDTTAADFEKKPNGTTTP